MFVAAAHRVGAVSVFLAVLFSLSLATVAFASVPGTGAVLTVSPGEGPVAQPFTVTYTGGQHCSGQGWSQAIFYLDGSQVGTAARQSGCEASLGVTPGSLSPVPGTGPHLVTASLVTPGGTVAATGLTATYLIGPAAGSPPPTPSPGATPTPSPSGSPSPAATPAPSPVPTSSPPSASGPPAPGSVSGGPPFAGAAGGGVFPGAPAAAIGALPGPIVAIAVAAPRPVTAPALPRSSGWPLVPFALGLLGLLLLYGVARLGRAPGGG